jgi:hypothetical protein
LWDLRQKLNVTADAAGLRPATYETEIELSNSRFHVTRCVPVEFTVEEPTVGVEEEQPARSVVSWGGSRRSIARPRETNDR